MMTIFSRSSLAHHILAPLYIWFTPALFENLNFLNIFNFSCFLTFELKEQIDIKVVTFGGGGGKIFTGK
jgi:hypothetical protein